MELAVRLAEVMNMFECKRYIRYDKVIGEKFVA